MELTILMPCLNEARTVAASVAAARTFLDRLGIQGEVLISDNGSEDGSPELAARAGARVVHACTQGYGAALIEGIAQARGRYVIMGDCDLSYDFTLLDDFLARLRQGDVLVMGNRFAGEKLPGAMPALHRYLGNPVLSFVGRLFFRTNIRDFHCGLRGFNREAMLTLNLVSTGMEFASEMVVKVALARLPISEVPTTLHPDGRDRPPHLRTWRDGWRHLKFLLIFCPRWLFFYPGMTAIVLGLLGFATLANGPLQFSHVGLGIHSFLYMSALIVLGVQWIQMAMLTQWMGFMFGLVPRPGWMEMLRPWINTESGLLAALGCFLGGVIWSLILVLDWSGRGFSALDPTLVMRSAIPAVTLMIVGLQIGAGSMFASALQFCWNSVARQKINAKS